ncbi:MAG: Maf family protein [Chlamydiales bacterium]|nr:Maf family protein [Chlamydiales bacterium]
MLEALSGNSYTFVTGLAVYDSVNERLRSTVECCEIYFRHLCKEEISDYISRTSVLKFAGAHDTDGVVRFSEKVKGNCNFFTAIPMNKLIEFLRPYETQLIKN